MRRVLVGGWLGVAGRVLAQAPPVPPAALQPPAEERGIPVNSDTALLLSTAAMLVGAGAGLVWTASGKEQRVPGLGMVGLALVVAPSSGRLAAGDVGGSAKHLTIRAVTAAAGAIASAIAAPSSPSDSAPIYLFAAAGATGAVLLGEAIWDIASTSSDTPAAGLDGNRIHLSIAPLVGLQLLQARGIPTIAPVLPETQSAYALPGVGIRAAVEGSTVGAGLLLQYTSVTAYPLFDTRQTAGHSLRITATRLLFTVDSKWPLGPVSVGGSAAAGLGATSTRVTTRDRFTGALRDDDGGSKSELALRIGPAVGWPIARYLSVRAEAALEWRMVLDSSPISAGLYSGGHDAAIGGSVFLGVVARL